MASEIANILSGFANEDTHLKSVEIPDTDSKCTDILSQNQCIHVSNKVKFSKKNKGTTKTASVCKEHIRVKTFSCQKTNIKHFAVEKGMLTTKIRENIQYLFHKMQESLQISNHTVKESQWQNASKWITGNTSIVIPHSQ